MSKALKCDSCGVCFDPEFVNGEFISIRELVVQDKDSYKKNEVNARTESINFCVDCTRKFADAMLYCTEAKKKEKKESGDTRDAITRTVDELVFKLFDQAYGK